MFERPDSRDLAPFLYTFMILRVIFALAAMMQQPLGAVTGLLLLPIMWQVRIRHYVGIRILPIGLLGDGILGVFFSGSRLISNITIILLIIGLLFINSVIRENKVIPRPLYTYNKFETPKARKAYRTHNSEDIKEISKYRDWEDSPDPNK